MVKQFIDDYLKSYRPYKEDGCWCYEDGVMLTAVMYLYEVLNEQKELNFILSYLDSHIDNQGNPYLYTKYEYNIDNIQAGNVLFFAYEKTHQQKYLSAIEILRSQLATHPRTKSGNFFHKKRYPNQIWLDGLFMAMPFYARYAQKNKDNNLYEDIINQFLNVRKYLYDSEKKLYVHAYDEAKVMQWADKETGKSPNVWSRSVGWLAMALIDTYEVLALETLKANVLKEMLVELIDGMLPHLDGRNKMWYQIVDKPRLKDNYLETSGSSMLAYAMMKGYRLNVLPENYCKIGESIYKGIIEQYLKEENGKTVLKGICKVAGLDNEKRDGSNEYYLSEPVVNNDTKGVGPFIMAYTEKLRKD